MDETQQQRDDAELAQVQRSLASLYNVERMLTRRATGVVYQAAEIKPSRPILLTMFPAELGLGPAAARFKEVARLAVPLDHPSIVPIYRVGFKAGVPFFAAMKPVEGRSLAEIIEAQGALSVPAIVAVLRSSAAALAYAHERGAVHGALRDSRILVDRDGHVMVAEFGIARAIEDAAAATRGEETDGTAGPPGDQYALGIVALEMITGALQPGDDPLTSLDRVRSVRVALPEALVRVVQIALAQDPAQRFAGTADMVAAIQAIPFSDADGREAAVVLGRLARGEPVPKLRALSPRAPTVTATPAAKPVPAAPEVEVTPAEATAEPAPAAPAAEAVPVEPAAEVAPAEPAVPVAAEPAAEVVPAEPAVPAALAATPTPAEHVAAAAAAEAAPRGRSRLVWGIAAALVVVGAAGAAYWMLGRRPSTGGMAQAPGATQAPPGAATSGPAPTGARADSARPDSGGGTGLLLLSVVPTTAEIIVDGSPKGSEGFVDVEVAAGRRHLEIIAPGFEPIDTIVEVPPGATLDLGRISLIGAGAGRLRLRVSPPSAQIFVDGRQVGVGSLDGFEVAAGERQLRISAPGYVTLDTLITVDAGATVLLGQISLATGPGGP